MNGANKKILQPVKAYIRQRPMNQAELESKCGNIVHNITPREITVKLGYNTKKYNYEHVFGGTATQADVYNTVVSPLISHVVAGYNCTVFAFGQTGSGKTYTIVGGDKLNLPRNLPIDWESDSSLGIIPRVAHHLFSELYKLNPRIEYTVRVSFIELYNEEVRDLLKESLQLRLYEDPENKGSVYMKGLTEATVHTKENVFEYLKIGIDERHAASPNFNTRKPRSHTLFTFLVNTREITDTGEEMIKSSKFHLVDLAGNENIAKSGTREVGAMNKSICTLGKVIRALSQKLQHIPYRDSKLTRILQDSLGGTAKTCMIGTISPASNTYEETIVTLDYASFVRSVTNSPSININKKRADFLKPLTEEIAKLSRELQVARSGEGYYVSRENYEKMNGEIEAKNQKVTELLQTLTQLEEHRRNKETQYNALTASFQQSQEYLQTIAQELDAKKQKVETNRRILDYLRSREQELSNTANHLLQVCKNSTKSENIYYAKYLTLCNATLANADLVNKLKSACINALRDVENITENQDGNQTITLNNIKDVISVATKKLEEHLEDASCLAKNIELKANAENYVTLTDIFSSETTDFSEENVKSFINDLYEDKFQGEHQQLMESLGHLKNRIESSNDELTKRAENCSQVLLNKISDTSEFATSSKDTIQEIQKSLRERDTLLNKKKMMNESFYSTMLDYFQKSEENKKELLEIESKPDDMLKEWHKSVEQLRDKKLSQNLQESMKDYFDYLVDFEYEKRVLTGKLMEEFEEVKSKTESRLETYTTNLDKYLSEMVNTVQGNLSLYNQDLQTFINTQVEQANALKTNVIENARSTNATIEANIDKMSKINRSYGADVKKSVQESSDYITKLNEDAVLSLHAGDTPVKRTYQYPRRVPSPVPLQVLLEEVNGDVLPTEENE